MQNQDQAISLDTHNDAIQNLNPNQYVPVNNPNENIFQNDEKDQQINHSPKKYQDHEEIDGSLEHTQINQSLAADALETKYPDPSLQRLIFETICQCFLGFLTFFILVGFTFILAFFVAHAPTKSKINLSSYYIGFFWIFTPTWLSYGFNGGCLIVFSRFIAIKDYKSLKIVFGHGLLCAIFYNLIYLIYITIIYICIPYIYSNEPEYINEVKAFLLYSPIGFLLYPYVDLARNLFIANGCIGQALFIEFLGLINCIFFGWLLIINFDMGLLGIALSLSFTIYLTVSLYYGYYQFGSEFKSYWEANSKSQEDHDSLLNAKFLLSAANLEDQDNLLTNILEDHEDDNPNKSLLDVEKEVTNQYEENDLRLLKNFVRFNQWFAFQAFQNIFWLETFTLIVSENYSLGAMAAQGSLVSINDLVCTIGVGFGFVMSSKVSKFMTQKNIKQVKRLGYISCLTLVTIGSIIGIFAYVFCDGLAALLNNNEEVQIYLVKIIKIWAIFTPCKALQYALNDYYKSINQQKFIMGSNLVFNYLVQFSLIIIFMKMGDGSECVWKAATIQTAVYDVVLLIGQYFVDLKKYSEKIVNSVS